MYLREASGGNSTHRRPPVSHTPRCIPSLLLASTRRRAWRRQVPLCAVATAQTVLQLHRVLAGRLMRPRKRSWVQSMEVGSFWRRLDVTRGKVRSVEGHAPNDDQNQESPLHEKESRLGANSCFGHTLGLWGDHNS
ncbi:unnamed protein product, partial [Ixodes pacificus]